MQMTANLPDTPLILEAVLEGFVQAAAAEIAAGVVPPFPEPPIRYVEEGPGEERWRLPHEVAEVGQGDCEDLCFWEAAGMRMTGEDPGAQVKLIKTGARKLHAIVLRSDGSISDPSARLRTAYNLRNRDKKVRPVVSGIGCVGCLGDGGWDDEGVDVLGAAGNVRVIARNGQRTDGKGAWTRPVRDPAKSRPFTPAGGTWTGPGGQKLTESELYDRQLRGEQRRQARFDPTVLPPGQEYYPPGYMPSGWYPYQGYPPYPDATMMYSPMPYGSPYSGEPMYGFAEDYWGTTGDSPYGFVWGDGPLVSYEDLYGEFEPQPNPFGVSDDDDGEYV